MSADEACADAMLCWRGERGREEERGWVAPRVFATQVPTHCRECKQSLRSSESHEHSPAAGRGEARRGEARRGRWTSSGRWAVLLRAEMCTTSGCSQCDTQPARPATDILTLLLCLPACLPACLPLAPSSSGHQTAAAIQRLLAVHPASDSLTSIHHTAVQFTQGYQPATSAATPARRRVSAFPLRSHSLRSQRLPFVYC